MEIWGYLNKEGCVPEMCILSLSTFFLSVCFRSTTSRTSFSLAHVLCLDVLVKGNRARESHRPNPKTTSPSKRSSSLGGFSLTCCHSNKELPCVSNPCEQEELSHSLNPGTGRARSPPSCSECQDPTSETCRQRSNLSSGLVGPQEQLPWLY